MEGTEMTMIGDRYDVVRTVSEGERATVYQALDTRFGRPVALKVYDVGPGTDRDELMNEVRALLSIPAHRSLPVVRQDFYTDDGSQYVVVIDWVAGTDLEQLLDEQGEPGLPLSEVLDDIDQVAEALDHLHAQAPPIVHGDVKPANLVRSADGRIVLVDFDIASAQADGQHRGTVGFVAPEVWGGAKPTPAADVYGLAATIWTLLNGRPPGSGKGEWPGIDPVATGAIAAALRNALQTDPSARPRSATKLVERLRRAAHTDLPHGMVTFLATEVVNSAASWDDDDTEFGDATTRLRALVGRIVERCGGHVIGAEQDRAVAVFSEASAAVGAALGLQEELRGPKPLGLDLGVRIALEVGEAELVDGVYVGAALDRVGWLRSVSAPGAVVTSMRSAEVLRDVVDDDTAIIDCGRVANRARPAGMAVCGLARRGYEHASRVDPACVDDEASAPAAAVPATRDHSGRGRLMLDAIQRPVALMGALVAGLALIYFVVLAPEAGFGAPAVALLAGAVAVAVVSFARQYSMGYEEEVARRERERLEREDAEAAHRRAEAMGKRRRELEAELGSLSDPTSRRRLDALTQEYAAIERELTRRHGGELTSYAYVIPDLAAQTYMAGLSVLTQTLGLLEESASSRRRRLEVELLEVSDWLDDPQNTDEKERHRREGRLRLYEQALSQQDEAQDGACDALLEVERCEHTLHDARVQLASMRAGGASDSAESVIETLEANIRRVREVQDELRKLQH
jgi:hypothetical protein